jgi:hypothetical protein
MAAGAPPDAPVKRCVDCGMAIPASARICPVCGAAALTVNLDRGGRYRPGGADRQQLTRQRVAAMPRCRQLRWAGADYDRLELVRELRGYRPGWTYFQQMRASGSEIHGGEYGYE